MTRWLATLLLVVGTIACGGSGSSSPCDQSVEKLASEMVDVVKAGDEGASKDLLATLADNCPARLSLALDAAVEQGTATKAERFAVKGEAFLTGSEMAAGLAKAGIDVDITGANCTPPTSIEVGASFKCTVTTSDSGDYTATADITAPSELQIVEFTSAA